MRVYLFRQYDRFEAAKKHTFEPHVGMSLCRNDNAFGCPATPTAMRMAEKAKIAVKSQLVIWATGLGVDTDGTGEELKERILAKLKR